MENTIFKVLPNDIIRNIGMHIPYRTLKINKFYEKLKSDDVFWKMRFQQDYGDPNYLEYGHLMKSDDNFKFYKPFDKPNMHLYYYDVTIRILESLDKANKLTHAKKYKLKKVKYEISIFDIIKNNQIEKFIKYIGSGINLEVRDDGVNTLLIVAARLGRLEMVKILLVNKADLYAQNKEKRTALMRAAAHSNSGSSEEMVQMLLDHDETKKTLYMKDDAGFIPLMYAVQKSNDDSTIGTVKILLDPDIIDQRSLNSEYECSVLRNPIKKSLYLQDKNGNTALMYAIYILNKSAQTVIQMLIDADRIDPITNRKESLYIQNRDGLTVLNLLIKNNLALNLVDIILNADKTYNTPFSGEKKLLYITNEFGDTPLLNAVQMNNEKMVQKLVDADFNKESLYIKNADYRTPYMSAFSETIAQLVEDPDPIELK